MFGFKAISINKIISAVVASSTVSDGSLVLCLTGDGGYGAGNSLIFDRSSNAAAVTRAGDAAQIVSSYSPFSSGWSYYFDGSGDIISTPSNSAFALPGDFTIEAWVYIAANSSPDGSNSRTAIIASTQGFGTGATDGFTFQIAGNSTRTGTGLTVEFRVGGVNTGYGVTTTVQQNSWNHIAFVRSSTTLTYYLNGTSVGTSTVSQNIPAGGLTIGGQNITGWNRYLNGYISNLRIVKDTAVYTSNFTPSTSPLSNITNTSLLTCHRGQLFDASSTAANMSVTGNTTASTFAPFGKNMLSSAIGDNSIFFNGSTSYLNLSSSSTFSDFGTGDFTIECWAYRTGAGLGNRPIIGRGISSAGAVNWVFRWASTGNLQLILNTSANTPATVHNYSYAFPLNTWVHLAVTRAGTTSKLFINGTEVSSATNSTNVNTAANTPAIGGESTISHYFQGYISNLRVVKGSAVYSGAFTPPTSALTAVSGTSLLTAQSVVFEDLSTSRLAVSAYGSAAISSLNPFASIGSTPGSVYFDGTNDYITIPASASTNLFGGDFTIECWFNPISFNASGYNYLIMQDDGANGSMNFQVTCGSTGLVSFTSWNTSLRASSFAVTSTKTLKLGAWNHIAVSHVKSSNTTRLFVNGNLEASSTTAIWDGANVQTCLGNWSTGGGAQTSTYAKLNGYMSGVRLVKGSALYTASFSVPTSIPTAVSGTALLLNFNDGSVVDAYGSSSSALVTPVNMITFRNIKKFGSASLTGGYVTLGGNPEYAFGTGDFTIEMWIYPTATTLATLYDTRPNAQTVTGVLWMYYNNSTIIVAINNSNRITSKAISTNTWTHVALVRRNGTTRLYLDGVQSGSDYIDSTDYIISAGRPFICASSYSPGTQILSGYTDDIRVYRGYAKYASTFLPSQDAGTVTTPSSFSWVMVGGASDALTAASTSALALGTGDFTIEMWTYISTNNPNYVFLVSNGYLSDTKAYAIRFGNNGFGFRLQVMVDSSSTASCWSCATTQSDLLGTWTHLAFTRQSGTCRLFINGIVQNINNGINPGTFPFTSFTDNTNVGAATLSVGGGLNGYITDVRIVKGTALYTANFTPPTAKLTAVSGTAVLTAQNATAFDNSSNALTITAGGNARATTTVYKY